MQHSFSIANETGLLFRPDLNNALQSLASQSNGGTEPTTKYAFQPWVDTSGSSPILKYRNAANTAWIVIGPVDQMSFGLNAFGSGTAAPGSPVAFQTWVDTSGSSPTLKVRNAANSAWITIGVLDVANLGHMVGAASNDTTAGAGQTISAPGTLVVNLTGALTSLSGIAAVTGTQPLILVNKSGYDLTVNNEDATATAANRVITGTSSNITLKNNASLWLVYDLASTRWRIVGGSGGSNTIVTSSLSLASSGTLSLDPTSTVQSILVSGASAAITLSTTPFGSTAPLNGTVVTLIGNSDANTVSIPANDAAKGVLGYSVTLGRGQTVTYEYNSTLDRYVIIGVSN